MTTPTPRAVLVGVDGSPAADDAARAAALEAAALGTNLRVLRAFDWPAAGVTGLPADVDGRAVARSAAQGQLDRLVVQLGEWLPAAAVHGELRDGEPVNVLRDASAGTVLLVVGAHGQTWTAGATLGSVAAGVVRRAQCPVLVHRQGDALGGSPSGVVVGVDGGPGSAEVLAVAAREARLRGTTLHVLHTWPQLTEDAGTPVRWLLDPAATTTTEQAVVTELVHALRGTSPELDLDVTVVAGRASPSLVQASHTAELVVVGRPTVGEEQETRATTRQVTHRASCPVLVVPLPSAAAVPVEA